MSRPGDGDDAMDRARRIVGSSRIAAILDVLVCRSVAGIRSSRATRFGRSRLQEFRSLPPAWRTRCTLIVFATAVAGHVLLAATLLPASASPTLGLTTVALLGAALAAGASTE
jgi:hypothetical protein